MPAEMQRKKHKRKLHLNKKNMTLLIMKKTIDMHGKKVHMKMIVNVQTKMDMKKRVEANTTMAMNMNENMKEHEIAEEFHDECEEERQNDDEAECDAVNGNEILLNCLLLRRPCQSRGGGAATRRGCRRSREQKRKVSYFGRDSCRCSPAGRV
jgi:hypothetical protein